MFGTKIKRFKKYLWLKSKKGLIGLSFTGNGKELIFHIYFQYGLQKLGKYCKLKKNMDIL